MNDYIKHDLVFFLYSKFNFLLCFNIYRMSNQDTFFPMDDGQQGTFVELNANVGDSNQNDVPIDSIPGETESSTPTVN